MNQTAYRKSTSCSDAIFATLEAISRYLIDEGRINLCLYDLQKAFNLVKLPIQAFHIGINGKCWQLLGDFHKGTTYQVCLSGVLLRPYLVKKGVKQGWRKVLPWRHQSTLYQISDRHMCHASPSLWL